MIFSSESLQVPGVHIDQAGSRISSHDTYSNKVCQLKIQRYYFLTFFSLEEKCVFSEFTLSLLSGVDR